MAVCLVPGCSSVERMYDSRLPLDTPIEWWHGLQGGRIAEQRPPPPGVTEPYPNLAQVPPRPVLTDAATRRALAAQLAGERDRARRDAANDPLTLPGAPPPPAALAAPAAPASAARTAAAPAPVPAAPPPAPPPDPDASVVVLDAASAPPAPPSPAPAAPPPAPVAHAAAAPPSVPAASRADAGSPPGGQDEALPGLADAPPPAPRLPGVPVTPAQEPPRVRPGVVVAFPRGSAEVPDGAQAALRALAAQRGAAAVTVQGTGDVRAITPDAQAAALPLALRRAQAVAAVLTAAGVPPGAVRVGAQATGRGTAARLVD